MVTRRNLLRTGTAIAGGLFVTACAGGEASAEKEIFEVTRTDAEWRKLLAPEAYAVLRHESTQLLDQMEAGDKAR